MAEPDRIVPAPITDPAALRALAHPTRVKLLDLVVAEQVVTATRAAEYTGESVASCSYHLGILGKHGFITPAGDATDGRERPWRIVKHDYGWGRPDMSLDEALAVDEVDAVYIQYFAQELHSYMRRASQEPPEWYTNTGISVSNLYLTAAEAQQLREKIKEAVAPFTGRTGDPSTRPTGTRNVRMVNATWLPHRDGS